MELASFVDAISMCCYGTIVVLRKATVNSILYKSVVICTNSTMPRGRPRTTGARFPLPEALENDLRDFCEAHRGAPVNRIMQDALRAFIDERLDAEPELKKRFDEARRKRLGLIKGDNVTVLPTSQSAK